jgi:hypothetical protein
MKDFSRGVGYYTKATVEVGFPEDDICCYRCLLMTTDYGSKRERCSKTGEILVAPKITIGYDCPLKFQKEEEQCSEI